MKTKLRILLVEDDVADAELIVYQLQCAGFAFFLTRVQTETEFRRELEAELPDLILSDHGLPSFSGFAALEIARTEYPTLPFIFVSGSNDQGMVAHMHDAGATDYVFKRDLGDLRDAILEALDLPAEPPTQRIETHRRSTQPELKLQLPPAPATPPAFLLTIGQLHFCPQCLKARDEIGRTVTMENYCANRAEILVLRQLCPDCSASH